jgi:hypothetical protein
MKDHRLSSSGLSPDFAFVPGKARVFGQCGDEAERWRGLDSNFQYAGAVNLVVAQTAPG